MKHTTTGFLATLALTALTSSAAVVAAADPAYTFTRTPSHGKPGTVIHVEGSGCEYEGQPYEYAAVYLYFRGDPDPPSARAMARYDIADDGSFAGDLTVPDGSPAGRYLLSADCYASDMAYGVGDSDFTVDGAKPKPTPTHTATPTPTSTRPPTTASTRPTPSRTPAPTPSATRTASARPMTPAPTTTHAVAAPTRVLAAPVPSPVASDDPTEPQRLPSLVVLAAFALIAADGLGLRAALRRPWRR